MEDDHPAFGQAADTDRDVDRVAARRDDARTQLELVGQIHSGVAEIRRQSGSEGPSRAA
jgi:hypothetical protein